MGRVGIPGIPPPSSSITREGRTHQAKVGGEISSNKSRARLNKKIPEHGGDAEGGRRDVIAVVGGAVGLELVDGGGGYYLAC